MKDLTIALERGAFVVEGRGVAHFLFEDGAAARSALEAAGIRVLQERDVLPAPWIVPIRTPLPRSSSAMALFLFLSLLPPEIANRISRGLIRGIMQA